MCNAIIDTYGKPDEIRVELARELKKSAKEREELTKMLLQRVPVNMKKYVKCYMKNSA